MENRYDLSEEEIRRRRQRRLAKKKKRRIRKIKGMILLSLTLIIFIFILVGLVKGTVKVIKHFTHKDTVTETNNYDPNGYNDENNFNINNSYSNDYYDNMNSMGNSGNSIYYTGGTHGNYVNYAEKAANYVDITTEEVKAPYAVLLSADTSEIIAGRESDTVIFPASMTKVMTLIVAVDYMDRIPSTYTFVHDDIAPHIYAGASRAGFEEGETVPVTDILYGLILPSGADAATAIANAVAGSEEAFANLMNEKCAEIGLKNTHFVNPSGLYNEAQVTTCAEMAMIMSYAMQNELCAKVLSTYQYTTTSTPQNPDGLQLTSTMFSRMYGNEVENVTIEAGKTGYTVEAGNCMVSYATKNGNSYVCVTAASTNKWHCIFDAFKIYEEYIPK